MGSSKLEIIIGINDRASNSLSAIGGKLQSIGKFAIGAALGGVVALGAGIVAIASQAIPAASNLNEALNASSVVFGDAAKKIQDFGKIAAENAGLSASAFNQMAAQTGAMLTNFGLDTNTAADETIKLSTRAADLASIFNTDVNDSMIALQAALRGETEPARRFGISLNQISVEAKATELGFKKVNGVFDQNALTTARLALIYEQTDKIAGDFVNTSDGLANATRIQKARWENFMAALGGTVLPIVQELQGVFMDLAERVLPSVLKVAEEWGDKFGNLISTLLDAGPLSLEFGEALEYAFGPEIAANIQDIIKWVSDLITSIQTFVNTVIIPFVSAHAEEFKGALIAIGIALGTLTIIVPIVVAAIALLTSPVTLVIAAIALLGAAWAGNWGGIQEKTQAVIDFLKPYIEGFIAGIKAWWDENGAAIIAAAQAIWDGIKEKTAAVIAFLKPIIEGFITGIQQWWATNGPLIIAKAAEIWEGIKAGFEFFKGIFKGIVDAFHSAQEGDWRGFGEKLGVVFDELWGKIKEIVGTAIENIKTKFKNTDWNAVGKGIIDGIAKGITAGLDVLKKAAIAAAKAALEAAKGFLGIDSPSKVFAGIGMNMMSGMALGIDKASFMPRVSIAGATSGVIGGATTGGAGAGAGGPSLYIGEQNITINNGSDMDEIIETIQFANRTSLMSSRQPYTG